MRNAPGSPSPQNDPADAGAAGPGHGSATRRTLRNAGWLLGGKGVGGVFSLIYLGLAARSLGAVAFGHFTLILAFAQTVANLVQFQTTQLVIHFGARHLRNDSPERLRRLILFAGVLDLCSALACVVLAVGSVWLIGPMIGLRQEDQRRAALFAVSLLFALRGTPIGVLRLLDRFDVAALSETVLPAARLLAAVSVFLIAPSVDGFLAAWAVAEFATTCAVWFSAWRQLHARRLLPGDGSLRLAGVTRDNPQLWRFAWSTNFATSINSVWQQAGTLAVGLGAGPAAAGAYRIAAQLAQALSKPAVSLARAIFPELARLAADGSSQALARLSGRLTLIATIGGALAVLLVMVAGAWILGIVAGAEYKAAHNLLVLLTIAAAIDFSGFGLEPAVVAVGRPELALWVRAVTGLIYLGILALLLSTHGVEGAAAAAVAGYALYRAAMAFTYRRVLRSHSGRP